MRLKNWSFRADLNCRPLAYQASALPTELQKHIKVFTAGQSRNDVTTLQLRLYSWFLCTIANFLFSLCRLLLLPREYFNLGRINAPPRDATLPGGNGAPDGTRTHDTRIKSPVLYQLSYWSISPSLSRWPGF